MARDISFLKYRDFYTISGIKIPIDVKGHIEALGLV